MKHLIPLILPTVLLIACGGENSEPLKAAPNSTSNNGSSDTGSAVQSCGNDFSAQRSLNEFERTAVFWQIEGARLQSKPQLLMYADKFSLNASHQLSSDETLCLLAANIFGSSSAQTWIGEDSGSVNQGELYYYSPAITFTGALPELESLDDWRSQGSPAQTTLTTPASDITIWYRDRDENRFTLGTPESNQNPVTMNCTQDGFALSYSLSQVVQSQLDTLNPSFCETQGTGDNATTHCLSVALTTTDKLESCQFGTTSVALPDSSGNKTAVKVSGTLAIDNDDAELSITQIDIK
ncbi:hypothetical protein CWB99_07905 [Pseudoalteromonas rubra]|uniref:Uncharacterized protein n=1 Tax=Pseudoalteromonas rubra TaxID=43658 RepID=A0A5S3WMW5_9GAMM|nr:hypothetical protein [Pseudoalteromonas rubra]TMP29526.1 hypothetical protein CWB99_07905 [Pseudoalteromonas rubra]TMP35120.1 hypothetical protein CWC00_04870 [Pseudoalteromonas rubra]